MAQPKKITIEKHISFANNSPEFRMYFAGLMYRNINPDLTKNEKDVLEMLATRIFHPSDVKVQTFKDNKSELIEMITPFVEFEADEDPDNWECVTKDVSKFKLPSGEYYVGDLCYALPDSIYQTIWGYKFNFDSGVYRRKSDGVVFAMDETGGDGEFRGNRGEKFLVDAGHIGITNKSICKTYPCADTFYKFNSEVTCEFGNEKFYIYDKSYNSLEIKQAWEDEDSEW